jgi:hypothetical protein
MERRVFIRRIGRIVDRNGVLPDDFTARVDAVGNRPADARDRTLQSGEAPSL